MDEKRLKLLLLRVVRNEDAEGITVLEALRELDGLSNSSGLEGQMQHYLSKRSYEKALIQLETGHSCGHHTGEAN
jgi:hypothetical protein|tara:strand:- start:6271 stop:6495 length:225 start_codon:yes stop_codon:yes gene_type:complete